MLLPFPGETKTILGCFRTRLWFLRWNPVVSCVTTRRETTRGTAGRTPPPFQPSAIALGRRRQRRWPRSRATRSRPITRWTSRLVCTSIPHTTKPSQLYAGLVSAGMVASIVGILPLAAMMAAHRLLQEAGRRGSESSAAARTERADDSMTSWASLTTVTSSLRSRSTRHSVTREEHPSQKRSSGPRSPSSCATSNPRVSAASTTHDDDRSVRV